MSVTSEGKQAKRRAWGKPREREKVVCVDQMEIDKLAEETGTGIRLEETDQSGKAANEVTNLQRPELMRNQQLMAALKKMGVPLPVSTSEKQSREQLLYLFKKHVMPRPQRKRLTVKRRRRQQLTTTDDGGSQDDAMEWGSASTGREEEGGGRVGVDDWSEDVNRKRLIFQSLCQQCHCY